MRQNNILKVGLTGGIGSGKSTVSNIFHEKKIPIIDADKIAKEVLHKYPSILKEVRENFGSKFFNENGEFIRKKFGNYIFSHKDKKTEYEKIIMPYIKKDIFYNIEEYNIMNEGICIIDAPTLIENNLHQFMDKIIVVTTEKQIQLQRIMNRDKFTEEEARIRINSQLPIEYKCELADYIIYNNGTIEEIYEEVDHVINELLKFRGKNAE